MKLLKWLVYFFIFAFLITTIRACVIKDEVYDTLGDVTIDKVPFDSYSFYVAYGFPLVYMDNELLDVGNTSLVYKIVVGASKLTTPNFYIKNLIANLIFWLIIFSLVFINRNRPIFVKYRAEINYGLFFTGLFIISSLFLNVFGNFLGFLSFPGQWIVVHGYNIARTIPDQLIEPIENLYFSDQDLENRIGFIFAALAYFIYGVIVYKAKLWDARRKKGKKRPIAFLLVVGGGALLALGLSLIVYINP